MERKRQNLVGPQIRRLRTADGLSQDELAAKLQVAGWDLSRAGLSKIEAALRRVTDAELWLLADCLSCDMLDLFPLDKSSILTAIRQGKGL